MVLKVFGHYVSGLALLLMAGDLLIIGGSFALALALAPWPGPGMLVPTFGVVVLTTVLVFHLGDLYNTRLPLGRRELLARLLICQGACGLIIAALGFAVPDLRLGRALFLTSGVVATAVLAAWRLAWLGGLSHHHLRIRVLVLGTGPIASAIASLERTGARPFMVMGFVDDRPDAVDSLPEGHALLGKAKDLVAIVRQARPDLVVVAQIDRRGQFPARALLECRLMGVAVEDWPTFYEKETGKILLAELRPSWLVFSEGFANTSRTQFVKRCVDVVLAFTGLVAASPVMALAALAIKLESPGPVLFRQPRLGQHGRLFVLNKFRSMRHDAERETGPVWAQDDDPRVTRVGRVLRRTRIDELPQLVNVLVGDMSFIGPRPERPEFVRQLEERIPFYPVRLSVKPGITGWAQVRYRYGASVEDALEKLQYDLYYIKNLSLFLDLLILLNTMQVVLFARGR